MTLSFREKLEARWKSGALVCVGLDLDYNKILEKRQWKGCREYDPETVADFATDLIKQTSGSACAYKPNLGFYIGHGERGLMALGMTMQALGSLAPDVPVILDYKVGDIGNTNTGYVQEAFEHFKVDAVTVSPYLGKEALAPFLSQKDKGIIVLCRTSNPGSGEFQDMPVQTDWAPEGTMPLYQYVAMKVAKDWNENNNCCLVVGATYPSELRRVRQIVGDMPILIPGIGAQGGDLEKTVEAGRDSRGLGMIINSSRGIIFADDPFTEAAVLNNAIASARWA